MCGKMFHSVPPLSKTDRQHISTRALSCHQAPHPTYTLNHEGGRDMPRHAIHMYQAPHGPQVPSSHHIRQAQHHHSPFPLHAEVDRKSTRLNSSHVSISYAV